MITKVNKRRIMLTLFIMSLILNCGCGMHFCFDTAQLGTKEIYSEKHKQYLSCSDSITCYRWYYASDSILVCNADLGSIGIGGDLHSRRFSSKDIDIMRQHNNLFNHFFRVRNAKYGDESIGKCFFVRIPFRHKYFTKSTHDLVIPITYMEDGEFVIHDKKTDDSMSIRIRNYLFQSMDSASVFRWEERCKQGIKKEEHFNPYHGYVFL